MRRVPFTVLSYQPPLMPLLAPDRHGSACPGHDGLATTVHQCQRPLVADPRLSRSMTSLSARISGDRHRLVRGLVHGVLLSLVIWAAAGYVAFTLR